MNARVHEQKRRATEMSGFRATIYEPDDSNFRPWSLTTLIAFSIGRFVGRMFRSRRKKHVAKEAKLKR